MNNAIRQYNHTSIQNHTMKNLIDCPAERAVYFLGGKWKIRILFSLIQSNKKVRFGEFKKGLKTITQQMLSKQLKELEGME